MIPIALLVMMLVASPAIVNGVVDQHPGDPLYQVKLVGEQMELAAGMISHSELAKERINDYAYLAQKGAEDSKLLSNSNTQLEQAKHRQEMGYSEAIAYRDAVLGAVVESPQVSQTAKSQIRKVVEGNTESGYRIGKEGAPLPSAPPAGCFWDSYVLDGNLIDDIYNLNDINAVSPNSDLGSITSIDPVSQEYYVANWQKVSGSIYRLICVRDKYHVGPAPYRPPIDF